MFEYAPDDEQGFHPIQKVDDQFLIELTINSAASDRVLRVRKEGSSTQVECSVPWMTVNYERSEDSVQHYRLTIVGSRLLPLIYLSGDVQLGEDKLRVVVMGNRVASPTSRRPVVPTTEPEPEPESALPPVSLPGRSTPELSLRRISTAPVQPSPPIQPSAREVAAPGAFALGEFGLESANPRTFVPAARPPRTAEFVPDPPTQEHSHKPRLAALALLTLLVLALGSLGVHSWMRSRPAQLLVESRPSGAIVTIKETRGVTPFELKLPPGEYAVRLSLAGYKAHAETVKLEPGRESKLMTRLELASGSLSISSTPTRSTVLLDGKPQGTTPLHLKGLRPDTQVEVKVTRKGYLDYHSRITVAAGSESELSAVLKPAPASRPIAATQSRPLFRPARSSLPFHRYRARPAPKKVAARPPRPHRRRRRRMSALDVIIHRMATGQQ